MRERTLTRFVESRRLAWAVVGALVLVIAILSLVPDPREIVPISLWDKLSHFFAYGALALALAHALAASGWNRGRLIVAGVLLSAAYGGLMEGLQQFAPPRTPDLMDALSNFLGSSAGVGVFLLLDTLRFSFEREGLRGRTPVKGTLERYNHLLGGDLRATVNRETFQRTPTRTATGQESVSKPHETKGPPA